MPTLTQQDYYKKPTETAEQYNQRIAGLRGEPTAISTSSLKPAGNIDIPTPPTDKTDYSSIINGGNALLSVGGTTAPSWLTDILGATPKPTDMTSAYNEANKTAGIDTANEDVLAKQQAVKSAQNELALVNAQLQGITGEAQVQNLQTEGQGAAITAGGVQRSQAANTREAAIRAIPLQVQGLLAQAKISAAQGDEEMAINQKKIAQEKLNTLFNIQSKYEEQMFNYKMNIFDTVLQWANKEQQNQLEAKRIEEERAFTLKRDELAYQRDVALKNIGGGGGGGTTMETGIVLNEFGVPIDTQTNKPVKLTEGDKKLLDAFNKIDNTINQLEATFNKASIKSNVAPLARLGGVSQQFGQKLGLTSASVREYESLVNASVGPIARAVLGEVGVLTDKDVARARGALPSLTDTPEEARRKILNMRQIVAENKSDFFDRLGVEKSQAQNIESPTIPNSNNTITNNTTTIPVAQQDFWSKVGNWLFGQ